MKTVEFVSYLQNLGVKLWIDQEQLRYRSPKGVMTPELKQDLVNYKTEILELLREAQISHQSLATSIKPITRDRQLPLSFAQQRLWFIEKAGLSSNAYNIPLTLHLVGNLDEVALQQSLNHIIARHEILRTTFSPINGKPVQVIKPTFEVLLPKKDLSGLTLSQQKKQLQQLLQKENKQLFNLEVDPPMRVLLFKLGTTEYILQITFHHIASDGWSLTVFAKELSAHYTAAVKDQPSPLPELPIQYADFALWQRKYLQGQTLQKQLDYWKEKLQELPQLQLPTDHLRSAVQSFKGAGLPISLPAPLSSKLEQLTQQQGVTLFMALLAVFKVLLYRYTSQEQIAVGVPIANRNRQEIEGLIGFFVNSLVIYTDLGGEPSFLEVLNRVRQTALDAYSHQDLPFEKLVEELQPERSLSQNPLFQVMFAVQQTEVAKPSFTLPNLEVGWYQGTGAEMTVRMDLELNLWQEGDKIQGFCAYNRDLFEAETISRMLSHYQNLLTAVVENPSQPISLLPLMSDTEQQQLLVAWNNTKTDYPTDQCIHQLFEEQVERTPDAIAVVFEEQKLTYKQLNAQANQLAHYLQNLGVQPETLVGICINRSVEMLVGLLGILKAGGAYVPLDPSYPSQRLAYMLEDAAISVLLSNESVSSALPEHAAQVVYLDSNWSTIANQSIENPTSGVTPKNLAYVIYTSGSTGKPKGTMIIHTGVVNYLSWCTQAYQVIQGDRVPVNSSIGFDATVTAVFSPLLTGKEVILLPEEDEIEALSQLLCSQSNLSLVKLTPAHLQILNSLIPPEKASNQSRFFIIGGEALPAKTVSFWLNHAPETKLINEYGPTETVVGCCVYQVKSEDSYQTKIPIGRPIANTQLYILDKNRQPVPIGVLGELHIGGAGLARGYLKQEKLTAEKFIFWQGKRLYKTGDLARYLPDGNIEYIVRIDQQVKIRGYRIETGEIEASIIQYPSVQDTVVLVREDEDHKRLVAYLVLEIETQEVSDTEQIIKLKQYLKELLPEYMIPSGYVVLPKLPLTPNGKVDRKALPAPDSELVSSQEYIAPQTEIEETLAQIWQEVLRIKQVGIHDNFFEIGGDSIITIQIVARAQKAGIKLTTKQLFQNQTIAEQAAVAGVMARVEHQQGLVTGVVPLTPIQHWFWEQNLQEMHHFNQSLLLSVPPKINPEVLSKVIEKILEHHDGLRLRFHKTGDGWQQINSIRLESIPFEVVDLSQDSEAAQLRLLEKIPTEKQASLNLSDGPIVRVVLFNFGTKARLLIIIHHLAVDGVSWRILLEDLFDGYQQLSQGETIKLPEKTTAFQDWAVNLVEYSQSQKLEAEVDYWLNQPWSDVVSLPLDYPETEAKNTVGNAVNVSQTLSKEETTALLQEVPSAYNTQINDVLLTALVMSLGEWMGTETVLINLEGHGREEIFAGVDLSRTVGWFTSMFPVHLKRTPGDLGEALKSVKEQLRRIPERGIGYGILRYLSGDEKIRTQLAALPTAKISFNYLGQFNLSQAQQMSWQGAWESVGANQSPQGKRAHWLDINGVIVEGQLQITWTYSSCIHKDQTIANQAHNYIKALQNLITYCQSPENQGFTPSDFPAIDLTQAELDALVLRLQADATSKNIESIYPLSPMQEGLLFHTNYAPNSGVYIEQILLTLSGEVNQEGLKQSWEEVLQRHGVLRTMFVWESLQKPLQVVRKQVDLPWRYLDWQSLSPTEQQQKLEAFLNSDREEGFELDRAPLMRLTLIKVGAQTYKLLWSSHHILTDGWCVPIIIKEVLSYYESYNQGEVCHFSPVRPYQDYILWLQQQNKAKAEEFWRESLQGFKAPTPLIVERSLQQRTQDPSSYQTQKITLGETTTQALQSLVRQHRLTMASVVQAAWALLLSRYSGESEVLLGVTVSGRPANLSGVEKMVGLFINTLPLRVKVQPETKLIPWLQELNEKQLQLQTYSYSPLVEIQKLSEIPAEAPLFQNILVFENYPVDRSLQQLSSNLEITELESFTQTNYPLNVSAGLANDDLLLNIGYDTSYFDSETIARMLGHLQTLLTAIATNPNLELRQLPLMTEAELEKLLVTWNNTKTDYPTDKCIHQLFEKQVVNNPNAIAVVFEQQKLTYSQLNSKANQLAHYLQKLGVVPETLVGICVERSVEMVVGLLAILKAGGAYVSLDPNYPQERLDYMFRDSEVSVLLTQPNLLAQLSENEATVVCLERDWEKIENESIEQVNSEVHPQNLAYIIYTSGSTGKPKGVLIEHKGLCNLATVQIEAFQVSSNSRILQFASLSFDASIWEIVMALGSGASLYMGSRDTLMPGASLSQWLQEKKITHITIPPSALAAMPKEELPDLKTIVVAGEACPPELISQWSKRRQFVNAYGPTESTVCATLAECSPKQPVPPIGRPIGNTQIYILDRNLQPVPIGIAGELHIGGDGLARGYHNRPELTAEKFIPNPFDSSKSKLYKTGDLARYLPDGNIEFIGRIDHQVKIRGFRIEMGEIEALVSQYPDVKENLVIAQSEPAGDKRLIVYIVPKQESTQDTSLIPQIRQFLKQRLPEYMIPAAFVLLDAFPLTPNGKIDRRALPVPDTSGVSTAYVMPQTETEQLLAKIWQEVLQIEKVGIYDNFFELGGHSLLIIKVHTKLQAIYAQKISIVELFQYPTLSTLSQHLIKLKRKQVTDSSTANHSKIRSARKTSIKQQRLRREQSRTNK